MVLRYNLCPMLQLLLVEVCYFTIKIFDIIKKPSQKL